MSVFALPNLFYRLKYFCIFLVLITCFSIIFFFCCCLFCLKCEFYVLNRLLRSASHLRLFFIHRCFFFCRELIFAAASAASLLFNLLFCIPYILFRIFLRTVQFSLLFLFFWNLCALIAFC